MVKSLKLKDIVLIGMMSAILVTVQVALSFIPNIELVHLLIILYTLVFGRKTIYIIYVFVILEGFIYGVHLWWINYLYIWTILYILVHFIKGKNSSILWAIVSGFFGLGFGALCSIPYFFIGGPSTGIAYWISGIPFDLIHGISNFILTLLLFRPLYHCLHWINQHFTT
jgi:energy-coupling factor transport system substrate-specific component